MVDPTKNCIPDDVRHIHLIAVCGTGMGALACMLKDLGYTISGSDRQVYPPMSTFLSQKGIVVKNGFHPDHLMDTPDLVIVGNAVTRDNPEAVKMAAMGLPYCSMPQALNHFVVAGKKAIVITGTHGKTTTAAIAAWFLSEAGLDPSFMIGGILNNFQSNYRIGQGQYVVIEGDEYDTAFFDKGPKFLHYRPHVAVLTSIEFDHADIFNDINHIRDAFRQFVAIAPQAAMLIVADDIDRLEPIIHNGQCGIETYGGNHGSDWRVDGVTVSPPWTTFQVGHQDLISGPFRTSMMGRHNLVDTLAAIAVAKHLAIPDDIIATALTSFKGVKRRQEVRGCINGVTVMDDFAHHPTAVRETLLAVKPFYPSGRLIAVFEPRTNSSRRNIFQDDYANAFEAADLVCVRQPPLLEKIPPSERFSSEKLVADLERRGKIARFFPDTDTIITFVVDQVQSGDLVLIMSNGGFDNIHERLLARMKKRVNS